MATVVQKRKLTPEEVSRNVCRRIENTPQEWTIEEVGDFAVGLADRLGIHLPELRAGLREDKYDGKTLLAISESTLMRYGMSAEADRSKFLRAIQELKEPDTTPGSAPAGAAASSKSASFPRKAERPPARQKSRLLAALLALFLGSVGAHDFYLGRTTLGQVKVICTLTGVGLPVIVVWGWFDVCVLLCASRRLDMERLEGHYGRVCCCGVFILAMVVTAACFTIFSLVAHEQKRREACLAKCWLVSCLACR